MSAANKGRPGKKGSDNPMAQAIRCIDTGEVFNTIAEAARKYSTSLSNISSCLRGKNKRAKGLQWEYVNKETPTYVEKERKLPSHTKKVLCVDTNTVFSSIAEAAKSINVSHPSITKAIKNKTKSGGFTWKFC